jgi:hypothetical protein
MGKDTVPIELRVFVEEVRRGFIAELSVEPILFKFVVQRIGFSQIIGIAKLADKVCGP